MLADTLEVKQAVERTIERQAQDLEKTRKTYESMIASPEERALYEGWSKSWKECVALTGQVLALSRKEVGRCPEEAIDLNKKAAALGDESEEFLLKDVALNNGGAARETENAGSTYKSSLFFL